MRVLTYESPDKRTRHLLEIDYEDLLREIEIDHGWHEVIPMHDPLAEVRVFFDVDTHGGEPTRVYETVLNILKQEFGETSRWAVCSAHRENRISFHFYSKEFKITLRNLRTITRKYPVFDSRVLYFSMEDPDECGYCRLPNQTKMAVHKVSPPLRLEQGTLEDCVITHIEKLTFHTHDHDSALYSGITMSLNSAMPT